MWTGGGFCDRTVQADDRGDLMRNMNYQRVISACMVLIAFVAPMLLFWATATGESGEALLVQGLKAYQNGEYQLSIDKLGQAIPLLKGNKERIEAFKTMAFAYMAFLNKDAARQQFCNLLKIDPAFSLDPIMTPPKVLAVFEEAKKQCLPFGGIKVEATSRDRKSIHGARVYLNGNLIGETPLFRDNISPGEYELKLQKDGFRSFLSRVSIEEGVTLSVKSTLVRMRAPTITSVTHDAKGSILSGDKIEVTLIGDTAKIATFDIGNVKTRLPMQEVSPGKYLGFYRVAEKDRFQNAHIVGHLEDQHGGKTSAKAFQPISISQLSRSQVFFRQGKTRLEQGEYELAIDSLTKALYEDPRFVEAHILLAKAYSKKKGAYLESLKYLKNAIEIDGDNLEAHSLLAKIYLENRRYDSALPTVERILEIAPTSGFAHASMGEILCHKGKYREAISILRRSLLLDPEKPRAYFLLGSAFERLGRLTDAVFEFETAVELSPTSYEYRDTLATCYKKLGQVMAATQHWERCLEMGDLTEFERRNVKRRLSELRR